MKRAVAAVLALVLVLCFPICAFADAYGSPENAKKGVARVVAVGDIKVYINSVLVDSATGVDLWSGSAFAVGESGKPVSCFVTNRHVASRDTVYRQDDTYNYTLIPRSFYIIMDNAGTRHLVDIITENRGGADLAIIKLKESTTQREALRLHVYDDAAALNTSTVYSVGFPGSQSAFLDKSHEFASGVDMVSARKGSFDHEIGAQHTDGKGTLIQTDTPISAGNSGGPLVDEKGGVLGVCTLGTVEDAEMNAAVSVKEVVKLLNKNNISYETVSKTTAQQASWLIYGVIGAVFLFVIVMLIAVLSKRKKKDPQTQEAPESPLPPADRNPEPPRAIRTLIGVSGPMKDRRFVLEKGQTLFIGRDKNRCKVCFAEGTPGVSSMHCKISFDGRTAEITDLKSSYGTFVDRQKLVPKVPITLHRGLAVDIGSENNRFTLQ